MNARHMMLLATATLALQACSGPGPLNKGRAIGDEVRLETVFPEVQTAPRSTDVPSVWGADRSNWARTEVVVPTYDVQHQPNYTRDAGLSDRTRRHRNEFPTLDSAFDLPTRDDRHTELAELPLTPFAAAADVILFIPRLIRGPGVSSTVQSPVIPYERSPSEPFGADETDPDGN